MRYFTLFFFAFHLLFSSIEAEPYFIFVGGGTASGKTTFSKALTKRFGNDQTLIISLDHYLDKEVQPQEDFIDGVPNFDNPSMINWNFLLTNLTLLQHQQEIQSPIYDFFVWRPVDFQQTPYKPIIIIEGIFATQKELDIIPGLRIFLSMDEEKRHERRVVRDVTERHYTQELSEKIFYEMALPSEKIFLNPTVNKAHVIIEDLNNFASLEEAIDDVLVIFHEYKDAGFDDLHIRMSYTDRE